MFNFVLKDDLKINISAKFHIHTPCLSGGEIEANMAHPAPIRAMLFLVTVKAVLIQTDGQMPPCALSPCFVLDNKLIIIQLI